MKCLWLTGPPGAGKSTLGDGLRHEFGSRCVAMLDGDEMREGLNNDLDFSSAGRREAVRRAAAVAALLVRQQIWVIVAMVSPIRADREAIRKFFPTGTFNEIYVKCALAVCEARDPKGMYARARAGVIPQFTGVGATYEEPLAPQLVVETDRQSLDACLRLLVNAVG